MITGPLNEGSTVYWLYQCIYQWFFIFLQEVYEEEMESGEDTDGEKIKKSDVNIVRNYVVLRTLQEALTQFDTDLGKLSE